MSDELLEELDMAFYEEAQPVKLHGLTKDIAGQRFARLVAIKPAERDRNNRILWECLCDCGNRVRVRGNDLRNNKTKSCGCLNRTVARDRHLTHGMKGTAIYRAWQGMLTRCLNPNATNYHNYGGRGISVYPAWQSSFEDFHFYVARLPHFDEAGYSLDRIDNNQGYEPGNLQWSTRTEQSHNKRNNFLITFNNKTQCLKDWADETGINSSTIGSRIKAGWSVERALGTPTGK